MPIGDTVESQYTIVTAKESQASMIPLVISGSKLRYSAAVDVHEDDEDRPPPKDHQGKEFSRIRPNFVHRSYHTSFPSTSYKPIGDTEERQYTIVPANESQASMIPLVRSIYRLRISAAVDVLKDDEE
ncbi:hypothetical protein J6590_082132 [Homalodisca vitripennis]|nr:hypothetical protein J6590_082132 [Homalodisca vitripennis]